MIVSRLEQNFEISKLLFLKNGKQNPETMEIQQRFDAVQSCSQSPRFEI